MQLPKEECVHISNLLEESKKALKDLNSLKLKHLSNQTVHNSCTVQDTGNITVAVLLYALAKIIERHDYKKFRDWNGFVKRFSSVLDLAIKAIKEQNFEKYESYVIKARKTLESESVSLKPYIQDVLKKASINKASKLYEHGLSVEQTSNLLGVSQWELMNYIGEKTRDEKQTQTINTKTRAKMALEFFG